MNSFALSSPSAKPEWEARCRRCARCCHEKIEFEGRIYYTAEPCEFLDPVTRLCRVYPERHQRRPDCAPLTREVLALGVLPGDCPYVREIPNYPAPTPWEDDA